MEQTQVLRLQASDETMYTVLDAIEQQLDEYSCEESIKTELLIAAEEIYINIAHYAYGGETGEAIVQIQIEEETGICQIIFKDKGIPYNPLEKEDPNIHLSATERGIGGLGIYMVKQTMDNVEYQYLDSYNILKLEKTLKKKKD